MTTMKHRKSDTPDDVRSHVMDSEQIGSRDLARVGAKNASLGELFRALKPKGVGVRDGFATTAHAYRRLLREPAAVRSSATVEDLPEASFAGAAMRAAARGHGASRRRPRPRRSSFLRGAVSVHDGSAAHVDGLPRDTTRCGRCEVDRCGGNLLRVQQTPLDRHRQHVLL